MELSDGNGHPKLLNNCGVGVNYGSFGLANSILNYDNNHIELGTGGAPVIGACGGAGAAVTGNDVSHRITVGVTSTTTCAVTFGNAYLTAPRCFIMPVSMSAISQVTFTASSGPSTTGYSLLFSAGLLNSTLDVFCNGE